MWWLIPLAFFVTLIPSLRSFACTSSPTSCNEMDEIATTLEKVDQPGDVKEDADRDPYSRDPLQNKYWELCFDEVEHEWGYERGLSTEPETDSGKTEDGRVYACSMAQGYRNYMEDRIMTPSSLDDSSQIFGLFDGHGGSVVAGYVQDHLYSVYVEAFEASKDPAVALAAAFVKLDTDLIEDKDIEVKFARRYFRDLAHDEERLERYRLRMYREHGKKPRFERIVFEDYSHLSDERIKEKFDDKKKRFTNDVRNCGTTAVACVLKGDQLVVANVGDSRAILIRDKKALQLSVDHKPNNPEEFERIVKCGHLVVDGRVDNNINISRVIGDHIHKKDEGFPRDQRPAIADPFMFTTSIQANDSYLVLISDGIYESLDNDELADFIVSSLSQKEGSELELRHCAEEIIKACLEWRGEDDKKKISHDNVSVLLVKLNGLE